MMVVGGGGVCVQCGEGQHALAVNVQRTVPGLAVSTQPKKGWAKATVCVSHWPQLGNTAVSCRALCMLGCVHLQLRLVATLLSADSAEPASD
jgi:hypothetical protein